MGILALVVERDGDSPGCALPVILYLSSKPTMSSAFVTAGTADALPGASPLVWVVTAVFLDEEVVVLLHAAVARVATRASAASA